ncbi:hypothetical protein [Nocardiopsis sp. N85]|uniref:hypothetical protein n=1 Tax=Nocardiopsis sp. N85 TaxID=3029400 RepID=UPI00315800A9
MAPVPRRVAHTSPAPPGASGASARGGRLSWPFVVLALGLAFLVATATLVVVLDPWGDPAGTVLSGEDPGTPDAEPRQDGGAEGADPDTDAPAESPPTDAGEAEDDTGEPSAEGMVWTEDPEGFSVLAPEGWNRRTEGSSIYYESANGDTYLQIDHADHPTDDEYRHVLDQEQGVFDSGRLPGYEQVRIEDVTSGTDFHSVADWEFTWTDAGQDRHVLARDIAVSPGVHYTVAWASPAGAWSEFEGMRTAALDSFAPA